MLRLLRLLNLRRLRRQPGRAVITVVAVAAGVSMAVSVVVLTSSTTHALESTGRQVAGAAPLRVVGATTRGGLDPGVVDVVARTPGVAAAVPMVLAVTYAGPTEQDAARPVVVLGADCRVEQLVGRVGCDPAAIARGIVPAVTSRGLRDRLGGQLFVRDNMGGRAWPGVAALPRLDGINRGDVVFYPLPLAQERFGRGGRLDTVYVVPERGVPVGDLRDRLDATVGGWNEVLVASDSPAGVIAATLTYVALFGVLALFALAVGAVLVFDIMALALEERRHDLAVVGALGGTPATIVTGTLAEAAVLGLVGGLLGSGLGLVLADPLTEAVSRFTTKHAGVTVPVTATVGHFVLGAVIGSVVAAAATFVPVRRATRADVAAELSFRELGEEASAGRHGRRAAAWSAAAAAGVGVSWLAQRRGGIDVWQAVASPVALVVTSVTAMMAVGAIGLLVAQGLGRLLKRGSASVRLGAANLVRAPGRTTVRAIATGAAIAIAFVTASSRLSLDVAGRELAWGAGTGEVWVSTLGTDNTAEVDAKPSPALVDRLRAVPGVAAVNRYVAVLTGHSAGDLMGVAAADRPDLSAFTVLEGSNDAAAFEQGGAMIGPAVARNRGLRSGSRLRLDTPSGYADVPVVGVWQDGAYNGSNVVLPMSLFSRLYGEQPVQAVGLVPAPGVSPGELAARVEAERVPHLLVETPAGLAARAAGQIKDQLAPFDAIQRGLLFVAFVAVLSTLLLIGAQRRRELGLLAAVGMEPRQLARMSVAEAFFVGVIGVLLAVVGGSVVNVVFSFMLPVVTGAPHPIVFDFDSLLISAPTAVVIVTAAAVLPAWRSANLEVLSALEYE